MTPEQTRDLKAELDALSRRAQRLFTAMDAPALLKAPANSGWSVAENLQHLILTADAMLPVAEAAVTVLEGEARRAAGPSGLGFMGWLLVKALEPPSRMKSRTAMRFEPVSVGDPSRLLARLRARNDSLEVLMTRATGLATSTVTVVSPFNANVRYNLYAAFRIVVCHTRRHLWQAEQVKAAH